MCIEDKILKQKTDLLSRWSTSALSVHKFRHFFHEINDLNNRQPSFRLHHTSEIFIQGVAAVTHNFHKNLKFNFRHRPRPERRNEIFLMLLWMDHCAICCGVTWHIFWNSQKHIFCNRKKIPFTLRLHSKNGCTQGHCDCDNFPHFLLSFERTFRFDFPRSSDKLNWTCYAN